MTNTQHHRAATDAFLVMAEPHLGKLFPELSPHLIRAVISTVTCTNGSEFVSLNTHRNYLARAREILGVENTNELRSVTLIRLFMYFLSLQQSL